MAKRKTTAKESSTNKDAADEALRSVEACTATVQIGKIYDGTVSSVKDFGAFVEILPGRDGLCHISELSEGYVSNVTDVCNVGDEIDISVAAIDISTTVLTDTLIDDAETGATFTDILGVMQF